MKIVKTSPAITRVVLALIALLVVVLWLYFSRLDLAASLAYRGIDSRRPDARVLAEWLLDAAPSDPNARSAAARYFEGTFEPNDLERSRLGAETAAALSPNNFIFWQQLGAARDRNGDTTGAEAAYRRALDLAPNYASVQWAYGNSLIRHGKQAEGFDLISKAAASDPNFAGPAASIAIQALGDADGVRRVLGSTSATNAALVGVLGSQKKFVEAFDAWSRVEPADKANTYKDTGLRLMTLAADAHQTRIAAAVFGDLYSNDGPRPRTGEIFNGGFENGLKLRNAGLFEWQIAEGSDPQFGLSEGTKRTGNYSLLLTFNAFEASSFRTIFQRIAVEPGATYEFEAFYRADIKTNAQFRWEFVNINTSAALASTEPLRLSGDWSSLRAKFTVPIDSDGLILQIARTGCVGAVCPVTGKIFFDDLTLRKL